jgi:hypothetical protein
MFLHVCVAAVASVGCGSFLVKDLTSTQRPSVRLLRAKRALLSESSVAACSKAVSFRDHKRRVRLIDCDGLFVFVFLLSYWFTSDGVVYSTWFSPVRFFPTPPYSYLTRKSGGKRKTVGQLTACFSPPGPPSFFFA